MNTKFWKELIIAWKLGINLYLYKLNLRNKEKYENYLENQEIYRELEK